MPYRGPDGQMYRDDGTLIASDNNTDAVIDSFMGSPAPAAPRVQYGGKGGAVQAPPVTGQVGSGKGGVVQSGTPATATPPAPGMVWNGKGWYDPTKSGSTLIQDVGKIFNNPLVNPIQYGLDQGANVIAGVTGLPGIANNPVNNFATPGGTIQAGADAVTGKTTPLDFIKGAKNSPFVNPIGYGIERGAEFLNIPSPYADALGSLGSLPGTVSTGADAANIMSGGKLNGGTVASSPFQRAVVDGANAVGNLVSGGASNPSYVPQTGTGGSGSGLGGAQASFDTLNALAAGGSAGPAQTAAYGYQAPQQFSSGPGYVPYQDSGGGPGYVPYQDQNGGAGYVPYQDNMAGSMGYVPYQDVGGGAGYVPYQDNTPQLAERYNQEAALRQEDPLLGYIGYSEAEGPSKAEALLTTAIERAQATALGQAAMARGGAGAVASAQRQARSANSALGSRAASELAAMRADETERRQQRLLQGEIAARGRQVEELTAQRGRQSAEDISQRDRVAQDFQATQGRMLEQNTAAGARALQGEISARDRASQEEIQRAQRMLTGEVAARDRYSNETTAAANRMLQGEIAARGNASTESIAAANRQLTGEVSARDRASAESVAQANRLMQGEIAARGNASAEAIAAGNRASTAEVAAQDRAANSSNLAAQRQLEQDQNALRRQLDAAIASGNIASQSAIQDKINQNAIDRLYLADQLGTPTTEEMIYGGISSVLPIATKAVLA